SKYLIIPYVHTLPNSTGHSGKSHPELLRQLLTYRSNTTVRKVVDIIDLCFRVDQFDQIFNNGNDILPGKHLLIHGNIKTQLFIHTVPSYLSKVVTLIREK